MSTGDEIPTDTGMQQKKHNLTGTSKPFMKKIPAYSHTAFVQIMTMIGKSTEARKVLYE